LQSNDSFNIKEAIKEIIEKESAMVKDIDEENEDK